MAEEQLKNKATKGFIWNTVERLFANGINFLFTIILARLLSPDDYGIIAMPAIFLALAQVLIDSGFANALIRKQNLDEKDLSTAFYFNIFVGVVSYIILFLASPLIAYFFKTPILSQLLKVTALVVFLNSLGIVQQALMTKRMDFKTQAIITVVSILVSGVGGVWMAYNGYGVWSLVFQQVSAALLRVALLWIFGKWHPLWIWSKESFHYLWNFGSKVVIIGILDSIYNNVYAFIIGKMYNAKDLGNYTRAQQFAELPANNLSGIVQRVTFPLLSEIQEDNARLSSIFLRLFEATSLIIFPLMFFLTAIANPFIIALLGEEWQGCVLMFQILCITRMWVPLNSINLNLLQVKGRTDLLLKVEIAKKVMIAIIICLTITHGVTTLLLGFAVCGVFAFAINTHYTKKLIGMGYYQQLKVLFPALIVSMAILISVFAINKLIDSIYIQLIVDLVLGCFIYLGYIYLFKSNLLKEAVSLIRK